VRTDCQEIDRWDVESLMATAFACNKKRVLAGIGVGLNDLGLTTRP
jgi:hypothetical protein